MRIQKGLYRQVSGYLPVRGALVTGNNWGAVLFSGGRVSVPGGGCIGVVGMATLSALLRGES